jgi:autotransporter-associated beta strand protein
MKKFILTGSCLILSLLAANNASAAVDYWDPQGTTGANPETTSLSGTWENADWSTSSSGVATPGAWVETDAACFAIHTGLGSPAFTVTMTSNHTVAGFFDGPLAPGPCQVTVTGPGIVTLQPANLNGFAVSSDAAPEYGYLTLNVVLAGGSTAGVCPEDNAGQTFLNAANTYSGGTYLGYSGDAYSSSIINFNNAASFGTSNIYFLNCTGGALVAEGSSAITITNQVVVYNTAPQTCNIVGNPAGVTFSGSWTLSGAGGGTGAPTYASTTPLTAYGPLSIGSGGAANNLITISGVISGTNVFNKYGVGILALTAANTFSGSMSVSNGVLALTNGGSINSVTNLLVGAGGGAGGTFDVTGVDPYTLSSSVTLNANGAGAVQGTTAATINDSAPGGSINLGTQPINLGFAPTSPYGDSNHPSLYISAGALSLGGNVFTVTNNAPEPLGAGIYYLIQEAGSSPAFTDAGGETVTVKGNGLATGATASIQLDANGTNEDLVVIGGNPVPLFSNLTASQSITYGTAAISLAGKLSGPGPVYPASGETISVTIDGITQTTTISDSTGDFSLTFNTPTIPVTGSPWPITYAYGGDGSLNAVTNSTTALTITAAPVTVTATALSVNYGAAAPYTGKTDFTAVLSNAQTIGSVTMTGSGGAYAGTNTPVATSAYTLTPSAATGGTFTAANYAFTYVAAANALTVAPVALSITASAESYTYGQTYTGLGTLKTTNFTETGASNGQTTASMTVTLTASGAGGTATAPVSGSPYTITPSAAAELSGKTNFNPANYTITYHTGNLTENKATATVTATGQTVTYGTPITLVGSTAFTTSTLSNSETFGTVTLALSSTNIGTNVITPSAAAGGSGTEADYTITYVTNHLVVNPLPVILTGTEVYNGTNIVTNSILSVSNVVGSDNVTVASGSGVMASQDIGTNAIISTGTLALGGAKGSNYTLTGASGAVVVTPLPVTLTGTRPYDGTNDASALILTIVTNYDGTNLTLSGSGTLAGSSAGVQNISSFAGLTLGGTAATNYTLTGASGTVTITSVTPAFSGLTASQSIAYGTPTITLGGTVSATGPLYPASGETITVTINGNAQTTTISDSTGDFSLTYTNTSTLPVSGSPYTITYSYAGDTSFNSASDSSTALTVNPLAVVLTGTRPYDGTANAAFGILSVANAINGDMVNVASGIATLASPNVGPEAISSPGSLTLGGANAGNYTLTGASGTVTVTSVPLLITAQPQTITYGASVPSTTVSYSGFVNGETNTALSTQPTIASAQSGVVAVGTYTGNYTASGAVDANYSISYAPGTLTVAPAALTITANPQTILYGACVPSTTVFYSGFVNGETNTALSTQPTVASAQSGLVAPGTYGSNYTASGAVDANYNISYVAGSLTVNLPTAAALSPFTSFGANGWLAPGVNGYAYLGTANNERGLAYGNGHLYLVSHASVSGSTANVRILNSVTGADLGGLNNTGISTGTFVVNAAGVGTDGAIYVGNLTTQSTTTPYKVYQWATEGSVPSVIYSGNGGLAASRVGDDMAAIGGGSSTLLVAGYNSTPPVTGNNGYAIVSPTLGTATAIGFVGTPPNAGDFRLGITFPDSSHVIGTAGSSLYRYSSFSGTTGTLLASPAIPDPAGATADRLMSYAVVDGKALLGVQSTGDSHVSLYDLTAPAAPVWVASGNNTTGTLTANANATGALAWGAPTTNGDGSVSEVLYGMSTDQGIQAFVVTVRNTGVTPVFSGLSNQSIIYGTPSITLTGNVGTNTCNPVYPTLGDAVSATINGYTVAGAVTNSTGGFTITYNDPSLATDGVSGSPYTITYIYGGNTNVYINGATNTSTTLTLTPASQTITFGSLSNQTYGVAPYTLSASASSGLGVSFSVVSGPASIASNTITITGAGLVSVQASQAGNSNYSAAVPVTNSFTVSPLPVVLTGTEIYNGTITVPSSILSVANKIGSDNVTVASGSASMSSANAGTNALTLPGTLVLGGTSASNYTLSGASGSVIVAPLPVVLTGSRAYDGTTTAAASILSVANKVGSDNVTVASGSGTLASASVGSEALTSVGTLALGGTAAGDYTLAGATGSVTITNPFTPFSITSAMLDSTGTNLVVCWQSIPGVSYNVLTNTSIGSNGLWMDLGPPLSPVVAVTNITCVTIPGATNTNAFVLIKQ